MDGTKKFNLSIDRSQEISMCIATVYQALTEKGYDPVSQMVGFILSGDPSYITGHNGARSLIGRFERDELIEFLLKDYLKIKD